jgi:hypothetical protein
MLNTILACLTVLTWGGSYWIYFQRDIRRWWRLRHVRRAQTQAERERALQAYAAWVRNIPPPRSRVPVMPVAVPMPVPMPVPVAMPPVRPAAPPVPVRRGVVVPFPRGGRSGLRR